MNKTNSDEKDSLSQDLIVKRHKKRISKSAQEASGEYSYSSYYYDYSVDIWAAGITMGEMLIRYPFFDVKFQDELYYDKITSISSNFIKIF